MNTEVICTKQLFKATSKLGESVIAYSFSYARWHSYLTKEGDGKVNVSWLRSFPKDDIK